MAESPFRDSEIANRHRAEREADDARVLEEERAAAERRARAAERTKSRQRKVTLAGSLGLVATLIGLASRSATVPPIVRPTAPTAPTAPAAAARISVEPGELRADTFVDPTWALVRQTVDAHAGELAPCFDEGLASGALSLAPGRSGELAFDWEIGVGGAVGAAWAHRGPESEGEPTSETEECITTRIRTWDFGEVEAPAKAVGWRFEKCGDGGECVHRKRR